MSKHVHVSRHSRRLRFTTRAIFVGRRAPVVRGSQFGGRRPSRPRGRTARPQAWRSARLAAPLVTTPFAEARRVAVLAGRPQHRRPASTPLGRRRGCPGTRVRAKARPASRPASVTWLRAEGWSRDWRTAGAWCRTGARPAFVLAGVSELTTASRLPVPDKRQPSTGSGQLEVVAAMAGGAVATSNGSDSASSYPNAGHEAPRSR